MKQAAPQAGLVFDTLYREGEWVAAGKPIVVLLPPPNIKVRAFVPETRSRPPARGQEARVMVDGVSEPFLGKVSYISPRGVHPAGHLQPGEPGQARLHDRKSVSLPRPRRNCIPVSRWMCEFVKR